MGGEVGIFWIIVQTKKPHKVWLLGNRT